MIGDVKSFNNSLNDKFLDLLNQNLAEKFKDANLTRRNQRKQFEERKGGKKHDRD